MALEDAGHIVWWKEGGVNYFPQGEDFSIDRSCRVEALVTRASAEAALTAGAEPRATEAGEGRHTRLANENDRLRRALYRAFERHDAQPDVLSVVGSLWDTLDQSECTDLLEDWLITGRVIQREGNVDEMVAMIPEEPAPDADKPRDGEAATWQILHVGTWREIIHPCDPEFWRERGFDVRPLYAHPPKPDARLSVAAADALRPFAEEAAEWSSDQPDNLTLDQHNVPRVTIGDCRRAATALRQIESG